MQSESSFLLDLLASSTRNPTHKTVTAKNNNDVTNTSALQIFLHLSSFSNTQKFQPLLTLSHVNKIACLIRYLSTLQIVLVSGSLTSNQS